MQSKSVKNVTNVSEFHKWRDHFILLGEKEFKREIADYPYEIPLPMVEKLYDVSNRAMLDYCDKMVELLATSFPEGSYILFPNAMGRYVSKANSAFFKRKADAILFKLCI